MNSKRKGIILIIISAILVLGVMIYEKTTVQTPSRTEGHTDRRYAGSADRGTKKDDTGLETTAGPPTGTATGSDDRSTPLTELVAEAAAYDSRPASNTICYPYACGYGPGDTDNVNRNPNVVYYDAETLRRGLLYNLKPYAEAFVQAQDEYGIDAVFLAAVAAEESGYGRYTVNKNNIFGYGRKAFGSVPECIDYVAGKIRSNYLNPDGIYYKGCSVSDIAVYYNNGSTYWVNNITVIMTEIATRASRKDG